MEEKVVQGIMFVRNLFEKNRNKIVSSFIIFAENTFSSYFEGGSLIGKAKLKDCL